MATLSGNKIKDTYQSLIKLTDNGNLTTGAKQLTDGFGNNSPLYISTTQIGIGVTPEATYDLHVYSNAKVGGNLTVTGDLTVEGTTTTIDTQTLTVEDPLIEVASNNTSTDAVDIGWYGKYAPSGTTLYAGLFRDTGDSKFKLFRNLQEQPTTTINTSGTGYTRADLIIGGLEATTGDFTDTVTVDGDIEVENSSGFGRIEIGGSSGGYIDLKSPFSDDFDLRLYTAGTNAQINAINGELDITAYTNINLQYQGTDVLVMSSTGVAVTGTGSFTGQVTIPETPSANTDAASKGYVDDSVGNSTLAEVLANGDTTGGGNIVFGDSDSFLADDTLMFGASNDLVIYHDGSNSFIREKGTGNLYIDSDVSINLRSYTGAENMLVANKDGSVDLYYDASKKLETTSTGITVTGDGIISGGDLTVGDDTGNVNINLAGGTSSNVTLNFGDSDDDNIGKIIYRNASDQMGFITNTVQALLLDSSQNATFAGDITVSGGDIVLGGTGRIQGIDTVSASTDAASKGYVDSQVGANNELSEVLANGNTTGGTDIAVSSGDDITFTSTSKAIFNSSLEIYDDGSNSYIRESGTGDLLVRGNNLKLQTYGGADYLTASNGAEVELYYNDSKKFETTSSGVSVTGDVSYSGTLTSTGSTTVPAYFRSTDSVSYIQLQNSSTGTSGTSDGLTVGVNGNNAYVWSRENASLLLGTNDTTALTLDNSQNATFVGNIDINGNNKHIRFIDTYGNWMIEAGDGANNFKIHSQSLAADYLTLEGDGQLNLGEYGSGSFTGTATYRLAVDSSGDVIEIPIGGGAVDGSGTANYVTKWSDTDTITNSIIYDDGSKIGINTTPTGILDVAAANAFSRFFSYNASAYTFISIGRTSSELELGVSAAANQFFTGSAAGDVIIKSQGAKLHLGYGSAAPSITIDTSNRVGIGTTSPDHKLVLYKNIGYSSDSALYSSYAVNSTAVDNNKVYKWRTGITGNQDGHSLTFSTIARTESSYTERMRITDGGVFVQDDFHITSTSSYQGFGWNRNVNNGTILNSSMNAFQMFNDGNLKLQGYNSSGINQFEHIFYNSGDIFFDGSVGIGTTSPSAKLDVQSSGAWGQYGRGSTADINVENRNTSVTEGGWIGISGYTGNTANGGYYPMAGITAKKSTTAGDGNYGGDLSFWTTAGTGQSGEANSGMYQRMTINRFGNVGIGEDNPDNKLHIKGGSVTRLKIESSGSNTGVLLTENGSDKWSVASVSGGSFQLYSEAASTTRFAIDTSGNVGIGLTNPDAKLEVTGGGSAYTFRGVYSGTSGSYAAGAFQLTGGSTSPSLIDFIYSTTFVGQIVTTGSGVLYQSNSDYRLKENVVQMTGALDRVNQLNPSRFNFIGHEETVDGFLAHELQQVVPQAVTGEKDATKEDGTPKYQGVDHSQIVPLLVGAIKELKAEIETLKAQINN